jgi:nicotinate-nucleotide adenylyltransferase
VRIGVFGGSFDPIHNAHLIVARVALEQLELDRLLFMVAASQPFKQGRHVADAAARLHMVALAVAGIPDFIADDRELRRPPPSYTVDTLRELRAEQPDAELVLVMGADVASGMDDWHETEAIGTLAKLAVCDRFPPRSAGIKASPGPWVTAGLNYGLQVPGLDISSTIVRARAAAGKSLAGWVPSAVADYIVASRIYRSGTG